MSSEQVSVKEQKKINNFIKSQIDHKKEEQQQKKDINYYNQYCKLFCANAVMQTYLKELAVQKSQLLSKLSKLQKKADQANENSSQLDERKKRIRRSAVEIARHYKCSHQSCSKSYGSQGSLNQHIKLKHPQLFKSLNLSDNFFIKEFGDSNYHSSDQE